MSWNVHPNQRSNTARFRPLLSIVLAICLMIPYGGQAFANPDAAPQVESITAAVGSVTGAVYQEVEVPITFPAGGTISSYEMTFTYDHEALELLGMTNQIGGTFNSQMLSEGTAHAAWSQEQDATMALNQVVNILKFQIKGTASLGDTPIRIQPETFRVTNAQAREYTVNTIPGYVTVTDAAMPAKPKLRNMRSPGVNLPQSWSSVGMLNHFPDSEATAPDMLQWGDALFAVWSEKGDATNQKSQIYVKKYNGGAWESVGDALNVNKQEDANTPRMTVFNDQLYVVWSETLWGQSMIHLKKLENGNWVSAEPQGQLGMQYPAHANAENPDIVSNAYGQMAIVWEEVEGATHWIKGIAFDGMQWNPIEQGNALNQANGYEPQVVSFPYTNDICYLWKSDSEIVSRCVKWGVLGASVATPGKSYAPLGTNNGLDAMIIDQDVQYMQNTYDRWTTTNPIPQGAFDAAGHPDLAEIDQVRYAAWNEQLALDESVLRIVKQKNNDFWNWTSIGEQGISAAPNAKPVLAAYGKPNESDAYIAWEDPDYRIQVARYEGYHLYYHKSKDAVGVTDGGKYDIGDEVEVSTNISMLNPGYRFTGWNSDPDGKGTAYQRDDRMVLQGNVHLYAQWAPNTTEFVPNNLEGENLNPAAYTAESKLAVLGDRLYLAWTENDESYTRKLNVKQWDAKSPSWHLIGQGLNADPDAHADSIALTSYKDRLIAAWIEKRQIHVKQWDGMSWTPAGPDGSEVLSNSNNVEPSAINLMAHGDHLYAIWVESSEYDFDLRAYTKQIVMKRYDGSRWGDVKIEEDTFLHQGNQIHPKFLSMKGSTGDSMLLATWANTYDGVSKLRFNVLDEEKLTLAAFNEIQATDEDELFDPSLAQMNGELYAAWASKKDDRDTLNAYLWDGSNWSPVPGGAVQQEREDMELYNPEMLEVDGKLYIGWGEWTNHPDSGFGRVKAYTGSEWVDIDGGGLAWDSLAYGEMLKPDLVSYSDHLFVTWTESGAERSRVYVAGRIPVFNVTYNGNGHTSGSVPPTSEPVPKGSPITVLPNTGNLAKTGYTFGGWNTQADGKGTTYAPNATLTMGTTNITLYAVWTPIAPTPGGNPSSSGDATIHSRPQPTEELITVDVENGKSDGEIVSKAVIKRTTDLNGRKRDEVTYTQEQVVKTIEQLAAAKSTSAKIVIPDVKDEVSELQIKLPRASIAKLLEHKIDLEFVTPNARIAIPNASLAGLTDDVYFRLVPIKQENERKAVEQRAKTEQVVREYAGNASITVVGRPMTIETNMQSRPVTLVLPLPQDVKQEQLDQLGIFIEHSDGEKEVVQGEIVPYDKKGKLGIRFTIQKFSTFTVIDMNGLAKKHKAYIHGYPDGTFGPNRSITRAEMATMLVRVFDKPMKDTRVVYPDVLASHWAHDAIEHATRMGIMSGYPDGSFRPDAQMTRAEMAGVAARLKDEKKQVPTAKYPDTAGHWAEAWIEQVSTAGVMKGYEDGTFRPAQALTRAEAVVLINHLLDRGPLQGAPKKWNDVAEASWTYGDIQEASTNHAYVKKEQGEAWKSSK